MSKVDECICCCAINETVQKCQEVATCGLGEVPKCITEHPGFAAVCLDMWNLQAVYKGYCQHYGNNCISVITFNYENNH